MSIYPSPRWNVVTGVVGSLCGILLAASPLHANVESPKGTLVITVQDETGARASNCNIYIFGGRKELALLEVRGASANPTFDLPVGSYRLYAGYNRAMVDSIDHYSTPEAYITVNEGESTPVILMLHHHIPSSAGIVTETTLRHMGLSIQLAPYLD